jgi:hypothetical protein
MPGPLSPSVFSTLATQVQRARPHGLEQAIAALPSQVTAATRHGIQTLHTQKPRIEAIVNVVLFLKSGGVNPQALSQSVEAAEIATNMVQRGAQIEQVVRQATHPLSQTTYRAPKL